MKYRISLRDGSVREGMIVRLDDRVGDICPLPGFSRETLSEAVAEATRLFPNYPDVTPKLPSVQFAFDCLQHPIPPSMTVSTCSLNELKPRFSCVKLKVGHLSLQQTVDLIHTVPSNISLRLDFNRKWSLNQLLSLAEQFSPTRFDYLEEPTRSWSDLLRFSEQTNFPIALDESIPEFPYFELPSLKALVVKPTILGHLPPCPKGVRLVISSAYESGIGLLHLARMALEHAPDETHGLDPYSHLENDVLVHRPEITNGKLFWENKIIVQ